MSNVVAKVNAQEITEAELQEMVTAYQKQTQKEEISEEEKKMLLDNLIENKLLQLEAKERGLEVTEDLLKQQLTVFYQQFGGEENFNNLLTEQGLDPQEVVENVKTDLLGQLAAKDEVDAKSNVTEEAMQAFYEQHKEHIKTEDSFRASHILFKNEDGNAKESADKVLAELKAGGDFEALAKEHSACPSSAKGGDLNFFGKGQMVPEFENAVVSMGVDEVSDPVKTQFGYHIIKKTDHADGKQLTFDEAKNRINEILYNEQSKTIVKDLVDSLKVKFNVEYL